MTVIPPLLPQLLKALTPEENTRCQRGLFFQDGQRRVDYILTYPVKKPGGGRSTRQSVHRLTDNAINSLRGPQSKPPRLFQADRGRDSPSSEPSAGADVETGCPAETLNTQEDDKAFKREEFEEKLRGMGLELEKDEEVGRHTLHEDVSLRQPIGSINVKMQMFSHDFTHRQT